MYPGLYSLAELCHLIPAFLLPLTPSLPHSPPTYPYSVLPGPLGMDCTCFSHWHTCLPPAMSSPSPSLDSRGGKPGNAKLSVKVTSHVQEPIPRAFRSSVSETVTKDQIHIFIAISHKIIRFKCPISNKKIQKACKEIGTHVPFKGGRVKKKETVSEKKLVAYLLDK